MLTAVSAGNKARNIGIFPYGYALQYVSATRLKQKIRRDYLVYNIFITISILYKKKNATYNAANFLLL